MNILGNIIEGNADSYNRKFYGSIDSLGRKILGYNLEPSGKYRIIPSALEIFLTSMRDPAFYRLYKRIIDLYYRYYLFQYLSTYISILILINFIFIEIKNFSQFRNVCF